MMSFNDLKYELDGEPCSARTLIEEAAYLDDDFGSDGFKSTSGAARILRQHGHAVEEAK